jgi:NADH:ubiquinone oxidoreductase subunit E
MMKLDYDFDKLLNLPAEETASDERPHLRIVKCCGNCKYA